MVFVGYDRNHTQNRNSGSYELEPELTFEDPVLVKPEPELHLEIPVPVTRTRTVVLEFWFEVESQVELKYYCKSLILRMIMQKQL